MTTNENTEPITVHYSKEEGFHVPHHCFHLDEGVVKSLKDQGYAALTTPALIEMNRRGFLNLKDK